MYKKKNVLIGIVGFISTILLIVLIMKSGIIAKELEVISLGLGISLLLFFVGYAAGGLSFGIPLGLYMAALFGVLGAPSSIQGPLLLFFFGVLFLGPKLFALFRRKNLDKGNQSFEEEKESIFNHAIFLIKPHKWKMDITYKVVSKDNYLYFCKCGGQFYNVNPDIATNENQTEEELLLHKNSFRIEKDKVKSVEIRSKKRLWTGNVANNGSVILKAEEPHQFIIHMINDFPQVEAFFKKSLSCPVTVMIDPKQKQEKEFYSEFNKQSAKTKIRIHTVTELLNILGIISGLWVIFYPRPLNLVVSINLIIPLIALFSYMYLGRYVSFDNERGSPLPEISTAFVVPSIALSLLGFIAFHIIYDVRIWALVVTATIIVSIVALLKRKEYRQKKSVIIIIPIYIFVYFFGAITTTNCLFDNQTPLITFVKILDKTSDRNNTLVLNEWHQGKTGSIKVDVSERMYQSAEIGQLAVVHVYPGLWGIEWFKLQT